MTCTSCSAELDPTARFCGFCGREQLTASALLEGKNLRELAREDAPLSWQRVLDLLGAVCNAVVEARALGIAHPDLQPDSIQIHGGIARLLDVGIDLMRGDGPKDTHKPRQRNVGSEHGWMSTPAASHYMSPEKLLGKPLDERSNVYVIGIIGYELATGRLPFAAAKGPAGLVTAQLKEPPATPSSLRDDIPPALDALILRCLEKDPANRYADVASLADAIAALLR